MNTRFDSDIDVNANGEGCREDCTDQVQSLSSARYFSRGLWRLVEWLAARMKAHEDRVLSLRVYSQRRLDGLVHDARKDS